MVPLSLLVCTALFALTTATSVKQCPGLSIDGLSEDVELTPCKSIPCKLKKGKNTHISIKFTPEKDVENVMNHVTALVLGIPVPFVGVDGASVCDKIETLDGQKAPCPLKAGTRYVYKDSFPVLTIYPSLTTTVHWALQSAGKDVTCFEVEARIA